MKTLSFFLVLLVLALLSSNAFAKSSFSLSHHASRALVANDPNCYILALDGSCIECNMGYYLVNQVCTLGSQNCKTFDTINGVCTSCYVGYSYVNNSLCVKNTGAYLLAGCNQISGDVCLKCSFGYYVNFQGNCEMIDTLCKVFNFEGLRCATCYPGYTYKRSTGKCAYLTYQMDNNCTLWQAQTCLACDARYYLLGGACIESKPHCKQVNAFNICIQCFDGYVLSNNTCVAKVSTGNIVGATPNPSTDPNCAQHDANNVCTACYFRYYLNAQKVCVAVSDQCNTFDSSTGNCLSCYGGYTLSNGSCVITTTPNTDPNCAQRDANNVCTACYYRYFLNAQKVCVAVSDQCNTFDSLGNCLSCYGGYTLTNGSCVISTTSSPTNTDPNCAQRDANNVCTSCYFRYYLNALKVCVAVSDQCNTFDSSSGLCLSCYGGYTLTNGSCVVSSTSNPTPSSDPNCAIFSGSQCIACIPWTYYNSVLQSCQQVNALCKTYNSINGQCTSCYVGYALTLTGSCLLISQQCQVFDYVALACTQCISGFKVFNQTCIAI